MEFEPVIGLEVHAQLLTKSKIFCRCSTRFGAPANANTCPVCLGLPGALPVANQQAVAMAVKAGLALGCRINRKSIFARKNYFYPDLPKGYQISQFDRPIAEAGRVKLPVALSDPSGDAPVYEERSFGITRLHLEDDAGKSIHTAEGGTQVNLNRTGTPLVEIVTEADFRSSQEAYTFLNYLKSVLLYLDVCDGNMEEGSLRCDANVSIRPVGSTTFGTKTEIKNLNSFRFLRKALDYEIQRQIGVVQGGGTIFQETRLWDEESQQTLPMRSKEEAHDYRYFPEPDLLPLVVSDDWLDKLSRELPELPESRRARFVEEYGLEPEAAMQLTQIRAFADYFETAVRHFRQPVGIYNWMVGDLTRELKRDGREIGDSPVGPENLATLVQLIDEGAISGKIAKDVFSKMYESGQEPKAIIAEEGLKQISDVSELETIIEGVIQSHPKEVETYRSGKMGLIGFFVGQVMRETRGQANPRIVNELLREKLGTST
jgi:aspartyl-tRNA(Asn)/glutamyl-tRNA(Gln) amidotransferase subunit B